MKAVNQLWAVLFFFIYVVFMFFVVLNIFIAILNDAYTVVKTNAAWEQLDKRKPLSLSEKFEVRSAKCSRTRPAWPPSPHLTLTLASNLHRFYFTPTLNKPLQVRKAMWRERKNLAYVKKLKKEKIKAAKRAKKEYEKKMKEKDLLGKIGHRLRKQKAKEQAEREDAVGGGKMTRTQRLLARAKSRPH